MENVTLKLCVSEQMLAYKNSKKLHMITRKLFINTYNAHMNQLLSVDLFGSLQSLSSHSSVYQTIMLTGGTECMIQVLVETNRHIK